MAENENENGNESQPQQEPSKAPESSSSEMASNYFSQLMSLLRNPDDFFTNAYHGQKLFGLINLAALLVIVAIASFFRHASYGGFEFGDLIDGFKAAIVLGVPLAAVLFAYPWYAKQQGNELSLDFMFEKLGGAVALSALLILLAIPLDLLDIRLHSWFHGAGLVLVYIAVFLVAYWYVAPRRLAVATIAFLAFYFLYRLVGLIL